MIVTILVFLALIGVLVFVHEFGHFITAKRAGMRVEEFGLGFPPRLFGVRRGETVYSINLIPLGGFVKIHGEDGEDRSNPRSFASKSLGTRALVIAAGVIMNFAIAALLLSIGFGIGLPTAITPETGGVVRDVQVRVTEIASESPAAETDLTVGDAITAIRVDGALLTLDTPERLQEIVAMHAGTEIQLVIQRGDSHLEMPVVPRVNPPPNEGAIGFGMLQTGFVSYPWYEAIGRGIVETGRMTAAFVVLFADLLRDIIVSGSVEGDLAGPVGIASITAQATELGFIFVLQLAVLLSINLAILNAIPFPALDGGRLLFLVIEKIKGSPVSQRIEQGVHTAGFLFLIGLMILVTVRDIDRLL